MGCGDEALGCGSPVCRSGTSDEHAHRYARPLIGAEVARAQAAAKGQADTDDDINNNVAMLKVVYGPLTYTFTNPCTGERYYCMALQSASVAART